MSERAATWAVMAASIAFLSVLAWSTLSEKFHGLNKTYIASHANLEDQGPHTHTLSYVNSLEDMLLLENIPENKVDKGAGVFEILVHQLTQHIQVALYVLQ